MDSSIEILLMKERLTTLETKIDDIESKLDSVDKKLTQVIDALIGNKLTQSNGLVADVKEIGDIVERHDEQLKKVKWFWLGVISVGGTLAFLIELVIKFLSK